MNYRLYDALENADGDAKKMGIKKGTVMAIRNYRYGKSCRVFAIGCFVPDEEGNLDIPTKAEVIQYAKSGFPSSRWSTRGECQYNIPQSTQNAYHNYAMKQFYSPDEVVMAAGAPQHKNKKKRPNTPNVQPPVAYPIEYPFTAKILPIPLFR